MKRILSIAMCCGLAFASASAQKSTPRCFSGIYPKLAFYNNEGECGTGAVVPWAGSLWAITYGPHKPFGSSDKLYQISPSLLETVRPESIGGTPANRLIHRETNQLFIGPYAIDANGKVRVIPIKDMPGRLTGMARSVTDPSRHVVIATMEQGIYDVDVNSLQVKTMFMDGNEMQKEKMQHSYQSTMVKGVHGKGFYSGQGMYVFSNNGEGSQEALVNPRIQAGVLAEYDGNKWTQVRRNQFTEITSAGGIYGSTHPATDPLWSLGWDYKSVLLGTRDAKTGWHFYRVPKASNSYDGAHGWNTEWPRIRNVGTDAQPDYLMTMHGMFWQFPKTFSVANAGGLRPLSSYLKVIGDFCSWNGRLVFGCDDSAKSEFLNKRKAKGDISGPGQSQSNLWFVQRDAINHNGTSDACGSVWQNEEVKGGSVSEPYLLAGWNKRTAWMSNQGKENVTLTLEMDAKGNGQWKKFSTVTLKAGTSQYMDMSKLTGEWIRVKNDKPGKLTVSFVYGDTRARQTVNAPMFAGLSKCGETAYRGGLLYSLGDNRRAMGIVAHAVEGSKDQSTGYYELDADMNLVKKNQPDDSLNIEKNLAIPANVVTAEAGSYLIVDDANRRWRLPLGNGAYKQQMERRVTRICREVSTERDLFDCGGTFFELPAENADGYAKIRPVSTHNLQLYDYASYRGLLVMTGTSLGKQADSEHLITSADGKCQVWAGAIDDLWKLGKAVGQGGPWVDADVQPNVPSDPYLIGHYDKKTLIIKHQSAEAVQFKIEIDPTGDGIWMDYGTVNVKPGQKTTVQLPDGYIGRWIRFTSDKPTKATTWLVYR